MEPEAAPTEASEETVAAEPTPEPATDMTPSDEAPVPDSEQFQAEAPASEPEGNVGAQSPDVAPEDAKATKKATRQKKTPTGETTPKAPREESKTSQVIAMLKREGGVRLRKSWSRWAGRNTPQGPC